MCEVNTDASIGQAQEEKEKDEERQNEKEWKEIF